MPTNAISNMFKNRLNELQNALSNIEDSLKAANNPDPDLPRIIITQHINDSITAIAVANGALAALKDCLPFIEGLTTPPTPSVPPSVIPQVPPHSLATPQVNLCRRPNDDSDVDG